METYGQVNKKWYWRWWGMAIIMFALLISSMLVAFGIYVFSLTRDIKTSQADGINLKTTELSAEVKKLIEGGSDNYWLGAADPKITIVEFGDFACPQCEKSFSTIREISIKYKESIKIIYRDFPAIAEYSADLALAARCAGEQGFFWPMYDKLFANQGIYVKKDLIELFRQIGGDNARFTNCLDNKKHFAAISQDYEDGQKLGVKGTPTWFINGAKVEGNIPYYTFIRIIDGLLKK